LIVQPTALEAGSTTIISVTTSITMSVTISFTKSITMSTITACLEAPLGLHAALRRAATGANVPLGETSRGRN
jgi:hypothetical protein